MFDTRLPARPPDHRHPQSNNQVSPRENLVNKYMYKEQSLSDTSRSVWFYMVTEMIKPGSHLH